MTDSVLERMEFIDTAAQAFFTTRVVKRSLLQHYDDHAAADLASGVIMMVSRGEGEYKQGLGMTAKEGTQTVLFVCHIKVAESVAQVEVEKAEGAMIEEIKSFCRAGVTGMTLKPESFSQSQQLAHPYGWVVATLRAGPPQTSIY